ncbi:MAG: diguanylate cyclase [Coprobacillus sp.]
MRIHENDEINKLIDEIDDISVNVQNEEFYLQRIHALESLIKQKKDPIIQMVILYHKGNIAYDKGDMDSSQELTNKSLNIAKEINQTFYILRCYNTLAIIDSEQADYYSSISNYLQALQIADSHPEYLYGSVLLNNIGNLFVWMNEHEKALDYLLDAVDKYHIEKNDNTYILSMIAINIIEEYSILKQYDKINKWIELECLDEHEEIRFTADIILTVNEIDQLYAKNDLETIHQKLDFILSSQLKYDNYIYVFRSYMRLLEFAIHSHDKKSADLIITCLESIDKKSHIETFKYDYVVLKYHYYSAFFDEDSDGTKAKEVLKEYFDNSQKVIKELRNTYTRRLVIESELLKVRYEKENAEEYNRKLQKDIELDYFTRILNKVSIEEYITKELSSKRNDSNHALLLIDIDHFKEVNDTYGHDFGDEIILSVVNMINSCCSENILFGRFGGDEFVLFVKALRNQSFVIEFVNEILEKARYIKLGEDSHLTLSAGVYFVQREDNFTNALNCADEALYQAKREGRNHFCIYEEKK